MSNTETDEHAVLDENEPKKPLCSKCGSHRLTFTNVYGPRGKREPFEELVARVEDQAASRRAECEKWYARQKEALDQNRAAQLAHLQPDTEESAFLLLSDDAQSRQKMEAIQHEYEQAEITLRQQKAALEEKIVSERDAVLRRHMGPENVVRVVFCECCGEVLGIADPVLAEPRSELNPESSIQKLESAIQAMHQDLLQCLKTLTTRLSLAAKPKTERSDLGSGTDTRPTNTAGNR